MFVVGPYATQWILLLVNLGDINYGWDVRWLLSDNNLVFRNIWQGISQRGERLRQGSTIILMVYARSKYIRFMSSCWSLFGILRIFLEVEYLPALSYDYYDGLHLWIWWQN